MTSETVRAFFYVSAFFSKSKNTIFNVFLSCCTRFLEHRGSPRDLSTVSGLRLLEIRAPTLRHGSGTAPDTDVYTHVPVDAAVSGNAMSDTSVYHLDRFLYPLSLFLCLHSPIS